MSVTPLIVGGEQRAQRPPRQCQIPRLHSTRHLAPKSSAGSAQAEPPRPLHCFDPTRTRRQRWRGARPSTGGCAVANVCGVRGARAPDCTALRQCCTQCSAEHEPTPAPLATAGPTATCGDGTLPSDRAVAPQPGWRRGRAAPEAWLFRSANRASARHEARVAKSSPTQRLRRGYPGTGGAQPSRYTQAHVAGCNHGRAAVPWLRRCAMTWTHSQAGATQVEVRGTSIRGEVLQSVGAFKVPFVDV